MDASTRPSPNRHQNNAICASILVAAFLAVTPHSLASTSEQPSTAKSQQQVTSAPATHDIAIQNVQGGDEGLELSARFSEDNLDTVRDVNWSVRDETGAQVFNGITGVANASLVPGNYQVSANYGSAHITQAVTIHEFTKLSVSFVLNAGALRILPRVKGVDHTLAVSNSKIFALSGPQRGQLITTSYTPGEVLKMPAGEYRVESRFQNGNAIAVTDVKVQPGIMRAVNIDHNAGLAKLSYVGVGNTNIQWTIADEQGKALPPLFDLAGEFVLKEGHYTAEIKVEGVTTKTKFDIASGHVTNVALGLTP